MNIIGNITSALKGGVPVKASVVLVRKNVLDFNAVGSTLLNNLGELLGNAVTIQLVSATVADHNNSGRGVVGEPASLENYFQILPSITVGESRYSVTFRIDPAKDGVPGAIIVKNNHITEFFLKTVTIDDFPGHGRIVFVCNSWVYPQSKYGYNRVFFANNTYLRKDTPAALLGYRDDELYNLRGDQVNRKLEEWDRVYNYAYYNDLGDPDKGKDLVRPILGGTAEYPYPRRGKTGRPATKTDPHSESRIPLLLSLDIYVPRDERFGHLKLSDFLAYAIKALATSVVPLLEAAVNLTPFEFDSFEDVLRMYEGGIPIPHIPLFEEIRQRIPFEMIKEMLRTEEGQQLLKLPPPHVIKTDKWAWRTDEEFSKEMLAGVNPLIIRRLDCFPPVSTLDPSKYGNQNSTITEEHIKLKLNGLSVEQALEEHKLYIVDHHDSLMPYLNRINSTANKIYASRTFLLLQDDSTLKPLAIELSLPNPAGEEHGAVSKVYVQSSSGNEGIIWQMAKAYATVDDSGVHQLISHWLNTHAVMEPFVIATNRHLSVMHPVNKLLVPHYRDTMTINALARQTLINADGILEKTVFPGKYALEMSAKVYASWNLMDQAHPADLVKRGVAIGDPEHPETLELTIKDYPFAVDGLAIWIALKTWVSDYCAIYYHDDSAVAADEELQAWWKEVREVGHGDRKDAEWWPEMKSVSELVNVSTTVIWVASALHAAVNFGQYPYAGYVANRPTVSRKFMPEPGTQEYEDMIKNPEKAYLRTITSQFQTILGVSLIEILSTHASDEVYLGQRDTPDWTSDQKALAVFKKFQANLSDVEANILKKNADHNLKNRTGPANVPYKLLFPSSAPGITAQGIPNSVSI